MATTSLHEAAREGNVDAVLPILASNPASVNDRDRHSRTALHLAAWAGHEEVVRLLCTKNADVGAAAVDDMAAIHFASQKGHISTIRYLLAAGASINARTRKGMTALHYAVQGCHTDLIKLLVKRGANLSAENKAGKKPLDMAKDQSIVELIERADVECRLQRNVKESASVSACEVSEKEIPLIEVDHKVSSPCKASTVSNRLKPGRRRNNDLINTETDIDAEAFGPNCKRSKVSLSHLFEENDTEE